MLFLCTLLLYGCAEDKEEIVPSGPTEKPSVELLAVHIDGYQAILTGKVSKDGGAPIVETGFCYNLSVDGVPSLTNAKSKKVIVTYSPGGEFSKVLKLHPEQEYQFVFYAINSNGITYADVRTAQTAEKNIQMLLPGIYTVSKQFSYLSGNIKDYNVEIKNENGKFYIHGLLCAPLGAPSTMSKLELQVTENNDSENWGYDITLPFQQSGLIVNFQDSKYPTLLVNGAWLLSETESSFDVKGSVTYNEGVEINLSTGYGLVMCDPLTHEIKLDRNYPPVELVLGPSSYPGTSDEYPRPDCIFFKQVAE
ncbi:MAG: hypothetical protein ACRC9Q_07115 [Bacteroidales bacterium]